MSQDEKKLKGFSGLDGMTIELDLPDRQATSAIPKSIPGEETSSRGRAFEIDETITTKSKRKGLSFRAKWGIGIAATVILITLAYLHDKNYDLRSNVEEMPPQGIELVLSDNQIRYCLSQDIRLRSWSAAVDRYSQGAIDTLNRSVDDYNSRCSNYKYRKDVMNRVSAEVENRRNALQVEGSSQAAINY